MACCANTLPSTSAEASRARAPPASAGDARCLYEALLYSDDDDGAVHADVAQVIARLVRGTVSRLERIGDTFGQRPA